MTDLLLTHNVRESDEEAKVRSVARALTLATLSRLTGDRKGMLVEFLAESGLITRSSIVKLHRADLTGANLAEVNLTGSLLIEANLAGANLAGANLAAAFLSGANLNGADLTGANLTGAELDYAALNGVKFNHANMTNANIHGADLTGTDLTGADIEGDWINATTRGLPLDLLAQIPGASQHLYEGVQIKHLANPAPVLAPAMAAPPAGRRRCVQAKG